MTVTSVTSLSGWGGVAIQFGLKQLQDETLTVLRTI
jgi:hypothetical protein